MCPLWTLTYNGVKLSPGVSDEGSYPGSLAGRCVNVNVMKFQINWFWLSLSLFSFRCSVCQTPLPDNYYAVGDQPFCMDHFYETTAHKCLACDNYITGPTMVSCCSGPCTGDWLYLYLCMPALVAFQEASHELVFGYYPCTCTCSMYIVPVVVSFGAHLGGLGTHYKIHVVSMVFILDALY